MSQLVTDLVALANSITQDMHLQATVTHYPWLSQDPKGATLYGAGVVRSAIVEARNVKVHTLAGKLVNCRYYVAFIQPVRVNVNDKIVLPDGSTGPILSVYGLVNPDDVQEYTKEVYLG